MLVPGSLPPAGKGTAPVRVAVVDTRRRLRSVTLERVRLALRDGVQWDEAGLAVDPGRARAYVFATDAPVAEIALKTMSVSYRRVQPLFLRPGELSGSEVQSDEEPSWRYRRALWLGDARVLVFGRDHFGTIAAEDESTAAGAILVDTAKWSSCVLDAKASGAALVAGRVLVYGRGDRAPRGVRAYTSDGRRAFKLFGREHVSRVEGAGDREYVHTRRGVYVVNVRSGRVVSEIAPPAELVDVSSERS